MTLPIFSRETERLILEQGKTVAEASRIVSERARLEAEVVKAAKAWNAAEQPFTLSDRSRQAEGDLRLAVHALNVFEAQQGGE